MRIGFIGLGQVGGKLAGSLARGDADLTVFDLSEAAMAPLCDAGAKTASSVAELAEASDVLITCLPSPAATAAVMEGSGGTLEHLPESAIWLEMSTTDADEVKRLAALAKPRGITVLDCPVSGGCHRAATGNIAIFAGGARADFECVLPVLTMMGREILHTGPLGSASVLKVMTNYLASVHLAALAEAFAVMAASEIDLATTFDAIRISSGNSFVHETEGQVILNGSRDVGFTMALVEKDIGLFQKLADDAGVSLDISPLLISIFRDGAARYGGEEWSTNIVRRLEDQTGADIRAPGFPAELIDTEPSKPGGEVARR